MDRGFVMINVAKLEIRNWYTSFDQLLLYYIILLMKDSFQ